MDRLFARLTDSLPEYEIASMAMMLYSLPRPVHRVDAIIDLPGMGEDWRLLQAIAAWENNPGIRLLLVTGMHQDETTAFRPSLASLQREPFNLERTQGLITQEVADHTLLQAEWIGRQITAHNVQSAALYVSPYHLLRSYCTIVKSMSKDCNDRIPLVPMPVMVSPSMTIPETGTTAWEMIPGELQRIAAYQAKGDVLVYDEFKSYINWLWQQPIIRDATGSD